MSMVDNVIKLHRLKECWEKFLSLLYYCIKYTLTFSYTDTLEHTKLY